MADLVYLLVIGGFFALAGLFVKACERIIGPDEQAAPQTVDEDESLAA